MDFLTDRVELIGYIYVIGTELGMPDFSCFHSVEGKESELLARFIS